MECVSDVFMHLSVTNVGITVRYGLDGPGIESRWEARFPAPVYNGPEAHPASYIIVTESFTVVKPMGVALNTHPNLAARLKKK